MYFLVAEKGGTKLLEVIVRNYTLHRNTLLSLIPWKPLCVLLG